MTRRSEMLAREVELAAARAREGEARDIGQITGDYAHRGMGSSGAIVQARHERRRQTLRDLVALRLRREEEVPLAPEDEDSWYDALKGRIERIFDEHGPAVIDAFESDLERFGGGRAGAEKWIEEVRRDLKQLQTQYVEEARLLRERRALEVAVPKREPSITININQSQVGGINLGPVIGNIQNIVGGLQEQGLRDLAGAVRKLAEAIGNEQAFSGTAKRDALELVSAIGEEATKPPDQRRSSIVQATAARLWEIVKHVDKLAAGYELVKAAARTQGLELP